MAEEHGHCVLNYVTIRIRACEVFAAEDTENAIDGDDQTGFFLYFADDGLCWCFIGFYRAGWQAPEPVIGSLLEQDVPLFVEHYRRYGGQEQQRVPDLVSYAFQIWRDRQGRVKPLC